MLWACVWEDNMQVEVFGIVDKAPFDADMENTDIIEVEQRDVSCFRHDNEVQLDIPGLGMIYLSSDEALTLAYKLVGLIP
jgi:hypothetical protein